MRPLLLLLSLSLFLACNSGEKEEANTKTEDTMIAKPPVDPPPTVEIQPAGKIDIETFGELKLGQSSADLLKILGEPEVKSRDVLWAADGLVHQDWVWNKKGLEIGMSYENGKENETAKIWSITAFAPCTYKTRAGMGMGNSYAEVENAYKKDIDPEATDKTQITVGSVYGGIIFSFENDKVNRVFLGAAAE
jgi:hypothetical protein